MANVTVENASAMQVTLGTTVTAPQTSARAGAKMARSAATVGTACVDSASAQNQEPLGRHVRSAQPAQMHAAPRGNGPTHRFGIPCILLSPLTPASHPRPSLLPASQLSGLPASHSPCAPSQPCWGAKLLLTLTKIASLRLWVLGDFVRK